MSISVLVIGESGSGKSTSIRNLNPKETYIISIINKPLPFRNKYKKTVEKDGEKIVGNMFISDDYRVIIKGIDYINNERPEVKSIIIDDFQYIMANEFMSRANEKGYDKFTEITMHVNKILEKIRSCREDLSIFILSHSEANESGKHKAKTIGKMLDDKITLEGLFTVVLYAKASQGKYMFLTQNDGSHIAKSPMGMFDNVEIDNDLNIVKQKIDAYYGEDIPQ